MATDAQTPGLADPTVTAAEPGSTPAGRRRKITPGRVINYVLLVIVGLIFLIPLYWLVTAALKPSTDIYSWPLTFFPRSLELGNFVQAWASAPFGRYLVNSAIITLGGAALKLVLAVLTAYAFAYLPFPGKKVLFLLMLGALMVPGHVTLLINFITVGRLGLVNSYLGIILPGVASAFGTFLLRQHFLTLPSEVLEAAELDGAGHVRRLVNFVIPMARPAVITVALLALIDEWNGFIWPLIATNSDEMRTLPIGLLFLKANEGVDNWGAIMAGTIFVVTPMLILFLFARRYIVSGLAGASISR